MTVSFRGDNYRHSHYKQKPLDSLLGCHGARRQPMTKPFEGKVALVTGAGSGIGAATALLLAERGAAVAVAGRRTNKLDEVVAQITAAGGTSIAVQTDVSDPAQVQRAVQATVERFGALHHRQQRRHHRLLRAADRDHHRAVEAGARHQPERPLLRNKARHSAPARGRRRLHRQRLERVRDRGGPTPEYSSAEACRAWPHHPAAIEHGRQGIRVNELQPGVIDTEMTRKPRGSAAGRRPRHPAKASWHRSRDRHRRRLPASDEASYVNGAHLAVDGGFLA